MTLWNLGDSGMHPYIRKDQDDPDYRYMFSRILAGSPSRRLSYGKRSYVENLGRRLQVSLLHKRVYVKTVCSLHNTEWLVKNFPVQILILTRHPCAMVHSMHRRWPDAKLKDPQLQPEFCENFSESQVELLRRAKTPYEKLASRIGAYYRLAAEAAARHPEWIVVRHEDICTDPVGEFRKLYEGLELSGFDYAEKVIKNSNRPKLKDEVQHVQRISKQEIGKWKNNLTPEEIDQVAAYYCPFNTGWYSDFYADS